MHLGQESAEYDVALIGSGYLLNTVDSVAYVRIISTCPVANVAQNISVVRDSLQWDTELYRYDIRKFSGLQRLEPKN